MTCDNGNNNDNNSSPRGFQRAVGGGQAGGEAVSWPPQASERARVEVFLSEENREKIIKERRLASLFHLLSR